MSVERRKLNDKIANAGGIDIVALSRIRPMVYGDIDQVLVIEESSFPTPWSRLLFQREIELDFSYIFVMEYGREIIGYVNYWLRVGEVHIMNIAVKEEYRNIGVGNFLLQYSLNSAKRIGGGIAYLEVRTGNSAGHALYRKNGFEFIGVRRGYYTDTKEDALVMEKEL